MFGSKKQQIIRFEQNICHASVNDNSILFVRVGDVVTTKDAMFEVPFTHMAFVIKGGGDFRVYQSGTYPVFESKEEMKAWKNGVSVEIIYVPKETSVLIRWGTPDKVTYRDKISNKVIEVGARGQFGISITNANQFFRKVVGATKEFDLERFRDRFSAAVVNDFADVFLTVVAKEELTYDQFDANRKTIAVQVGKMLSEKFERDWGIGLVDFIIEKFNISAEDMEKIENVADEIQQRNKMKEYLAELERLDDKQWEREMYLKRLEQEDKAAYYEVLKVVGSKGGATAAGAFCPNCGHSYENGAAFCPGCGKKLAAATVTCPKCGKTYPGDTAFCSACGTKLN